MNEYIDLRDKIIKPSIEKSLRNWLDTSNKNGYNTRELIKVYNSNKKRFYETLEKMNKKYKKVIHKFKLPLAKSEFNYIHSIDDELMQELIFMTIYKIDVVNEYNNIIEYIKTTKTKIPKLFKCDFKTYFDDRLLANKFIKFDDIITCDNDEGKAKCFINNNDENTRITKILYVFEDVNAAYLKLPQDDCTINRKWCNFNNPNDKNFTTFDTCVSEVKSDKYLIAPGRFNIIGYEKCENNYIIRLSSE